MATVTKAFTENWESDYRATWTVTITGIDQTVSDDFTINLPTVQAKYVHSSKRYAAAIVGFYIRINNQDYSHSPYPPYAFYKKGLPPSDNVSWASGTTYTLPNTVAQRREITLSSVFNADNNTSISADVTLLSRANADELVLSSQGANGVGWNYYYSSSDINWGKVATITLNAPPTVTLGTPTYSNQQYAGMGTYTVPITTASALYGGDITKVTLTVGQDSTVQTYSSSTITNQTISVTPTIAGTYTPTITVEDSRGQITTETLPQITVNPYLAPSLDFDVFRSNSNGVKDDEGAYGLVTANVSFTDAIADLTQPTVKINGTTTNNVTWYSAYNATTGVSGAISDWSTVSSGDTIYGLINGSFAQTDSYQITIILTDSLGGNSSAITQTLPTAFYTIDFQAGGKEIAFGLPANDNLTSYPGGLFKCGMDAVFNGDVTANGDTKLVTGDTEIENPYFSLDTTAQAGTTDGDLYAAIVALAWENDVIE